MSPAHDPRPASRYQAVTPSTYRQHLHDREPVRRALRAPVSRSPILRHVPAQLVRLVLPA